MHPDNVVTFTVYPADVWPRVQRTNTGSRAKALLSADEMEELRVGITSRVIEQGLKRGLPAARNFVQRWLTRRASHEAKAILVRIVQDGEAKHAKQIP